MESSDSSLSSDWDVVNQREISEDIPEEPPLEMNLNNGTEEVKVCPPVGSGVHILTEEDINHHNDILSETNVSHHNEILNEAHMNHHNDSNSSSDIDVIEEGDEDMHRSGMLLSPIEFLNTTLVESGPLVPAIAPAPAPNIDDGWNNFLFTHRLLRNPQFKDCLIVIFISIAVASTMHLQGTPENKIKQMKEQVDELKKENTDLKERVISKIEDDGLFQTLEEQINTLKTENRKLSSSLEFLILHIQEQMGPNPKNRKKGEKDPYQIEIDSLKEQLNLLKIDNDDLQQQLVRMRYGAFSPYSDDAKDDSGKKEVKLGQKEDAHENSSDILTKEIEKLREKLYSEVNDLKDWKKSIDNIIKQLNEKEKKGHENQDDLSNKKAADDTKSRKHTKEETHEKKKKEKFYDWSWKDFKKNFRGTFDNINVSDMLSKYVNVHEKKVKDYFETVGNYFKKAQEKTKNMFKQTYSWERNEKGKNDVWDFLGTLRNKWATMKHEFYGKHHKKGPQPPEHEGGNLEPDFPENHPKFENEKKRSTRWVNNQDQHSTQDVEHIPIVDFILKNPRMKPLFDILNSDPVWQAQFMKFLEEEGSLSEHGKKPENSWMFKRAAVRSILREQDEEEDLTNWFLRRKKPTREEGSGLRKEEDDLIN